MPLNRLIISAIAVLLMIPIQRAKPFGTTSTNPFVIILGIAQDAGYPQAGCQKTCCQKAHTDTEKERWATALAVIDPQTKQYWIIDATPDFKAQLHLADDQSNGNLAGIFLTHAHMGHYTGLMHLGREAMGAQGVNVYAMPRMQQFLENNGPWSQLVALNNINLQTIKDGGTIHLTDHLSITPFLVPHRDEFSETVGYRIKGKEKELVFIPDIDKWEKWGKQNILDEIVRIDYALLDGTFFQDGEIPGRNMADIPHPFVEESMTLFGELAEAEKQKVYFIHLNHTNPLLDASSRAFQKVTSAGYKVAEQGQILEL